MKKIIIIEKAIIRESGYLYFIDKQGNVCKALANRKGGKKGRLFKKKKRITVKNLNNL
jgi:hypothetical protein